MKDGSYGFGQEVRMVVSTGYRLDGNAALLLMLLKMMLPNM